MDVFTRKIWPPVATPEHRRRAQELKTSLQEWSHYLELRKIGSRPKEPTTEIPSIDGSFDICELVWLELLTSEDHTKYERVVDELAMIRLRPLLDK
mmetsp:Transcript_25166/g.75564  ORF Transcript_25166/g.75564 Transcript_25166/m.75564 type:complete len:96 (+) Transcript_25166:229-516(+)